jgi:hypothetical protein
LEWTINEYQQPKINLKDVTFIIPIKYDHKDRIENLTTTLKFITDNFETNIIIGEQGGEKFKNINNVRYIHFNMDEFHRTKMINDMVKVCLTPIFINWDADVLVNSKGILDAVNKIRVFESDFVYPYNHDFIRIGRIWIDKLNSDPKLISTLTGFEEDMKYDGKFSVGGAIVCNKKSFIEAGMENENFISHAPEDRERYCRFIKLGFKVDSTSNKLFHINHYVGLDSKHNNDHVITNRSELRRIKDMDKEQLIEYISKWAWKN